MSDNLDAFMDFLTDTSQLSEEEINKELSEFGIDPQRSKQDFEKFLKDLSSSKSKMFSDSCLIKQEEEV